MRDLIEVYGDRTGNCLRVTIALEEAAIGYSAFRVDLARGEQREALHLRRNPFGQVPTIVDRRVEPALVLSQSNAILLYLAEGSQTLLPQNNPVARALVYERFFYFVTDVIAPSHGAFQLRRLGKDGDSAKALSMRSLEALMAAERYLSDAPYMSGREFGIADIAAVSIARNSADALEWSRLPSLRTWYESALARPGVQRGLRAFGEPQ